MKTYAVESSNIQGLAWCPKTSKLAVTFSSGDVYEYQNVTGAVVADVMFADSVGSAFNRVIKKAPEQFPYTKIGDGRAVVSPAQLAPCPDCSGKFPAREHCQTCLGFGTVPAKPTP